MNKLTREEKAARYAALPVALIQKPLKHIAAKVNTQEVKEGKVITNFDPIYTVARRKAARGDGAAVKQIAKAVV